MRFLNSRQIVLMAAFVMPLVMVKLAALWLGGGAEFVEAAIEESETSTELEFAVRSVSTPEDQAAVLRAEVLAASDAFRSPFYHTPQKQSSRVDPVVPTRNTQIPIIIPPDCKIQAFMSGAIPVVLIDKEYYHEGDMLDDQWKIKYINVEERTVDVIHQATGTEATLNNDMQ